MVGTERGALRIGALSSRVGVSTHTLRAWESRYGVLTPTRSEGGYRLYSPQDEARVQQMKALLTQGLAPAQAARLVLAAPPGADAVGPAGRTGAKASATEAGRRAQSLPRWAGTQDVREDLRLALDAFDEPAAQAVLDRAFAALSLDTVLREVVVAYLADLGDRWAAGCASVAQEHFASNVLRGRLTGLARGWGGGGGPRAVLACPPGELHDLALMVFGVVLARRGWAITYLGISTPVADVAVAAEASSPALVVVASADVERLEQVADELAQLARQHPLALAGAGAGPALARRLGARLLDGDPVTQAELVEVP